MGRRRSRNHDLPPGMHRKAGRYYFGRNDKPLGADLAVALRKWADLSGERLPGEPASFAAAVVQYRIHELPKRAAKTQTGYSQQLDRLVAVFGRMRLDRIRPVNVREFLKLRPAIAGTRDKAVLSLVFNFARNDGLTDAPNPCIGVRGVKSKRSVYVDDVGFGLVLAAADQLGDRPLRDFLELAYRTGADASVILRMTRQDVQDGALRAARSKTGRIATVTIEGPLQAIVQRLLALSFPVQALNLILDERGQGMRLAAIRRRFWKARKLAGATWQIRDLRAKSGTDAENLEEARKLLAHAQESTTALYRRSRIGERARPIMREIAEQTSALRKTTNVKK